MSDTLSQLQVHYHTPRVDQLILGGSCLGCLYKDLPAAEARATIDRALDAGIQYCDTAPWYGAGLSEARLGEALKGRSEVLISTKCGRIIKPVAEITEEDRREKNYEESWKTDAYHNNRPCWTYTGDGVRESVRQSCERLGVDTIFNLRLHDAETEERFAEAVAPGGGVEAMIALKKEGKVTEISIGMNKHAYILKVLQKYPGVFDNIMMAGSFNLVDNDSVPLLEECQRQGLKVVNVGVFASGLLWGGDTYKYDSHIPEAVKEKVRKWSELAVKYGFTLPQVAFNFAFLPKVVTHVAFGSASPAEVEQNVALCGKTIPPELWQDAKQQGLIHSSVPLP